MKIHYPEWNDRSDQYKKFEPAKITLRFNYAAKVGRSAVSCYFTDQDGDAQRMMLTEANEVIPLMVRGEMTGTFRIIKRGTSFGLKLVVAEV